MAPSPPLVCAIPALAHVIAERRDGFFVQNLDTALFLRAEREDDARRTFKVVEAEPLPTSYGEDLYRQIFAKGRRPVVADQ